MSEYENKENRQRKRSKNVELNATINKRKQKLLYLSNGANDLNASKRLAKKLNQLKVHKARTNRKQDKCGSRICGNGKSMPSLTELEQLYEDSEEDYNYEPLPETQIQEQTQSTQNKSSDLNDTVSLSQNPDQCQAILQDVPHFSKENLLLPTNSKRCALKIMEYLEKVLESTETNDNVPPLPMIPKKKAKKSNISNIVGCKDHNQVEWKPQVNFCKDDGDYGVKPRPTLSSNEELQIVKLRRSKNKNTKSDSNLKAKSVKISQKLKLVEQHAKMLKLKTDNEATSINHNVENVHLNSAEQDHKKLEHLNTNEYIKKYQKIDEVVILSDESNDSVKTVCYDYNKVESELKKKCLFSPKPSTSSDQETILENDKNFEKSLIFQAKYLYNQNENSTNKSSIIPNMNKNEDEVVIIDENDKHKDSFSSEDTGVNDIYSSINIPFPIQMELDEFDNDYDKLLADNRAIIEKCNKQSLSCETIHIVDSNQIIKTKAQANGINSSKFNNSILIDNLDSNSNDCEIGKNLDIQDETNEIMTSDFILESTNNPTLSHHSPVIISQYSNQSFQPIVHKPFLSTNLVSPNHVTTANILGNTVPALDTTRKRSKKKRKTTKYNRSSCINKTLNIQPCLLNSVSRPSEPSHTTSNDQRPHAGRGSMRDIGDCPICMDSLSKKQVASTMCGHVFCLPCIKETLRTWSKKCPSCRKTLKGVGYHQLFL